MLTNLFLRDKKVVDEGCEHLAKADWNIFTLDLSIPFLIRGINRLKKNIKVILHEVKLCQSDIMPYYKSIFPCI